MYIESIPEIFCFCVEYTHKYGYIVYTRYMESNASDQDPNIPKPRTIQYVLYVHGRRVIITLTIVLLIIGIIGVLYYNGKIVYENGL